jgi:hypothetical protein
MKPLSVLVFLLYNSATLWYAPAGAQSTAQVFGTLPTQGSIAGGTYLSIKGKNDAGDNLTPKSSFQKFLIVTFAHFSLQVLGSVAVVLQDSP